MRRRNQERAWASAGVIFAALFAAATYLWWRLRGQDATRPARLAGQSSAPATTANTGPGTAATPDRTGEQHATPPFAGAPIAGAPFAGGSTLPAGQNNRALAQEETAPLAPTVGAMAGRIEDRYADADAPGDDDDEIDREAARFLPPLDDFTSGPDDAPIKVHREENPEFTGQTLESNPSRAASDDDFDDDDPAAEPDTAYFPPTDPVIGQEYAGDLEVVNGFAATSDDDVVEQASTDGAIGDEELTDTIRRELRRDASTHDLAIHVRVRGGVARLTGVVPSLEDAENAEDVAGRVPGVQEVREELDIES